MAGSCVRCTNRGAEVAVQEAVGRASGLELELLVAVCPWKGAAAESGPQADHRSLWCRTGLLRFRPLVQGAQASTALIVWHQFPTTFCFRYQLAVYTGAGILRSLLKVSRVF